MRDCANCEHYVVTDTRTNWGSQETTKIYGCELRECKFKTKKVKIEKDFSEE